MAATLTWFNSGLGVKTGTTAAALIDDLVTLFNSKSADNNFAWQVASSANTGDPLQITLKRKSGAAGRILLLIYTSAPASQPAVIFGQAPTANSLYGAFFPQGNVDTPSNLTAAGGTVMGNDTGAVPVWAGLNIVTIYTTSVQAFYFDSAEAVMFGFQNPETAACYMAGAGYLAVDQSDQEWAGVLSFGTSTVASFSSAAGVLPWTSTFPQAGTTTPCFRTNYGSSNRVYFQAWYPSGPQFTQPVGSTDLLTDTTISRSYFLPVHLLGQIKNEGFVLKLRQIGFGPATTAPFTPYNTTGPVVQARQFNAATAGGSGYPWFTNFKL